MQFYCGRFKNFLRFRESENSVIFDLLPEQRARIKSGEATIDGIYDEIMADPVEYVNAVKKNGITNLISIYGSLDGDLTRSNGAGKSTILESISFVLYGKIIRQAINKSMDNSVHDVITKINGHYPKGIKESWVEWLFEEKGKLYKIKRGASISGKSKSPIWIFDEVTSKKSESLSGHRTGEVRKEIVKVIGYDFDVFSSSLMFGQNDSGKFLVGKDKERKEIIVKILHLEEIVSGCLESVRDLKRGKEKEMKELTMQSDLIAQRISEKPTVDTIKKSIEDNKKLIEDCDISTSQNNDEIEILSKSDILKELETIKAEGVKTKSDIVSKKSDQESQTKEWKNLIVSSDASLIKKNNEISDNLLSIRNLESRELSLKEKICSFKLDEAENNLKIVEKAKIAKPAIVSKLDKLGSEASTLVSSIAVEEANVRRLNPEYESLKKQLLAAGQNDQFICDKCKSIVAKKHIEDEVNKIKDFIDSSKSKKSEYEKSLDAIRKESTELKDKLGKVESWLIKEGQILASIQNNENNKTSLVDIGKQINSARITSSRLIEEREAFEKQKTDYGNKIVTITAKYQEEISSLEIKINVIREKYLKIESESKELRCKIESIRKKNEEISNNKSSYSSKIGSMQKEIEHIESETKKLSETKIQIEDKTKEFQRLILLDDIFGLEGIQTRIVNKYLPVLNHYMEEFLTILSNGEMETVIKTNTSSAIDIDIKGNTGDSYNMISGGEKGLLRLSASVGLSLLSFIRTAQKPEMICLDEIFGPLDEARRTAVFSLLAKLQSKFSRVIVISHNSDVNDSIPNRIWVDKTGGKEGISKIKEIV